MPPVLDTAQDRLLSLLVHHFVISCHLSSTGFYLGFKMSLRSRSAEAEECRGLAFPHIERSLRVKETDKNTCPDACVVGIAMASNQLAMASFSQKISRNKKLLGTSASLLVTSALLVVTRSY